MRFVIFTHSLVSDWNHGNAHFLRGIASELIARSHSVRILEPTGSWSRENLIRDHGQAAIDDFQKTFPDLTSELYDETSIDLDEALKGADVVLVHEWNSPELVRRIGAHRSTQDYKLFFHDTHHRSLSDSENIARYDLRHYDGVLAYGNVIRDAYTRNGWTDRAWTWHEAADVRVFRPIKGQPTEGDLVWIGNWGDDERADTLYEFLIEPVKRLGLKATIYGVRYPEHVLRSLQEAGIRYGGWLANFKVPQVFARHKVTVHVPRRPYVEALPGIPTIRPFEALACGIPLISAPWKDSEGLFTPGEDFLFASNGLDMTAKLNLLLSDSERRRALADNGLRTIRSRHTCSHRVEQLLQYVEALEPVGTAAQGAV